MNEIILKIKTSKDGMACSEDCIFLLKSTQMSRNHKCLLFNEPLNLDFSNQTISNCSSCRILNIRKWKS